MGKIDKNNFREDILNTHTQFEQGIKLAGNIKIENTGFDSIVFCGLGGSQMPGYFLQSYFPLKIPVINYNNYGIPQAFTKNPLFIISSFSGNTEETLSSYEAAEKNGFKKIVFFNGGKLEKLAKKNNDIYVKYNFNKPGFQPRCATPAATSAMAATLENSGLLKNTISELKYTDEFLEKNQKQAKEAGKRIAEIIKSRIPLFYASYKHRFLALINKIKINENSKFLAFSNFYPELNHNEMNGYQNDRPHRFLIISLEDPAEKENYKRAKITNDLLRKRGYEIENIELKGDTDLKKVFYGFHIGDWISYYFAIENNQDPNPVDMVEEFKKQI